MRPEFPYSINHYIWIRLSMYTQRREKSRKKHPRERLKSCKQVAKVPFEALAWSPRPLAVCFLLFEASSVKTEWQSLGFRLQFFRSFGMTLLHLQASSTLLHTILFTACENIDRYFCSGPTQHLFTGLLFVICLFSKSCFGRFAFPNMSVAALFLV